MTTDEVIEAQARHIAGLRTMIETATDNAGLRRRLELAEFLLQCAMGWQAVESLLSEPEVISASFVKINAGIACNVQKRRGLGGNGVKAFGHGQTACAAAIAAKEQVK